jgi:hypothetical protein
MKSTLKMAAEDTTSKTSVTTNEATRCYNTEYHIHLRFSDLGVYQESYWITLATRKHKTGREIIAEPSSKLLFV